MTTSSSESFAVPSQEGTVGDDCLRNKRAAGRSLIGFTNGTYGEYLDFYGELDPPPDRDEQRELALRMALGNEALALCEYGAVGLDRARLQERITNGAEARAALIVRNIPWALEIASRMRLKNVPLEETSQEGITGLVKAADKFDYTKGYTFTTYATWWIRQSIQIGHLDLARMIRLPQDKMRLYVNVIRETDRYEKEHGEAPEPEQIAQALDKPVDKVLDIITYALDATHLDAPTKVNSSGDEGEGRLVDSLYEERDATGEAVVTSIARRQLHEKLLEVIEPDELHVLLLFMSSDGRTLRRAQEAEALGMPTSKYLSVVRQATKRLAASSEATTALKEYVKELATAEGRVKYIA